MPRSKDARLSRRDRRASERATQPRDRQRSRLPAPRPAWQSPMLLVSFGAIAVAVVAIAVFTVKPPTPDANFIRPAVTYPSAMIDRNAVGSVTAPVVIDVYSDFQCPVCGRFAKEYLPRLVTDFVAEGRLRLVSRDIDILGRDPDESLAAAVAADCAANQGAYWAFHDFLFWNQAGENLGAFSSERLGLMADELGLDRGAWDACVADPAGAATVRATTASAAGLGITATPTLSINGQLVRGLPASYDALAQAITQLAVSAPPTTP